MKSITENVVDLPKQAGAKDDDICPALILVTTVMCDALEQRYEPSRRQIRECCINENYRRCTLLSSA